MYNQLSFHFRRYRQNIKSFITFITGPLGTALVSNMMSDATGSSASSRASPYALTTRGGTASKSAPRRPRRSRRYTYMIQNKICLSAIFGKLLHRMYNGKVFYVLTALTTNIACFSTVLPYESISVPCWNNRAAITP